LSDDFLPEMTTNSDIVNYSIRLSLVHALVGFYAFGYPELGFLQLAVGAACKLWTHASPHICSPETVEWTGCQIDGGSCGYLDGTHRLAFVAGLIVYWTGLAGTGVLIWNWPTNVVGQAVMSGGLLTIQAWLSICFNFAL
jgi:hypothetical protein